MKPTLFILICLLSMSRAFAGDVAPGVKSFVREMLDTPDFQERWKAVTWEEYSMDRKDPNGGYLFRFELKFEHANDRLLFVATDRFGDIRRGLPVWYIYHKQSGSDWKKVATTNEMFSAWEFYIDQPTRTIIQHYPVGFVGGMTFWTLKFNTNGTVEKKYYRSGEIDDALKSKLEKQGVQYVPDLEKVPVAAYLRSPELKWRPLDRSHELAGQSLDVGDAALLAASTNLTWKQAVELGKSLTNSIPAPNSETNSPVSLPPQKPEPPQR